MSAIDLYKKGFTFFEISNILDIDINYLIKDFEEFDSIYYEEHKENLRKRIEEELKIKKLGEIALEKNLSTKYIKNNILKNKQKGV